MNIPFEKLLADFRAAPPGSEMLLRNSERALRKQLPEDYRVFILGRNGGEGFIGKHYLILWKVEEIAKFNDDYEVGKYAPGLILFGSTGGGDGFAFDTRATSYHIVQVPFIGLSIGDSFFVAHSFTRLLERMAETDGPLF